MKNQLLQIQFRQKILSIAIIISVIVVLIANPIEYQHMPNMMFVHLFMLSLYLILFFRNKQNFSFNNARIYIILLAFHMLLDGYFLNNKVLFLNVTVYPLAAFAILEFKEAHRFVWGFLFIIWLNYFLSLFLPAYEFDYLISLSLIYSAITLGLSFLVKYLNDKEEKLQELNETLNELVKKEVSEKMKVLEENQRHEKSLIQQSKNAAMGELIANIAHQWRQPLATLNGIILNFDFDNENKKLDQKVIKNYLDQMENLSLHMSDTIENFNNYFNPKKEKSTFQIDSLVKDIQMLLKFSLIKSNINFSIIQNQSFSLNTYYSELLQILLILINNAKDACLINNIANPKIIVTIQNTLTEAILEVEDNAGGIPNNIINKIYEPYFTTKHKSQGTGLGLHIVNTLLTKSLGGIIETKNTINGAKFIIKIKK
jgi:signal transduction histidine kinase